MTLRKHVITTAIVITVIAAAGSRAAALDHKIDICHKGKKTLNVDAHSYDGHSGHGDTLGACDSGSYDPI